ncbi:hypothetical protein [Mucilaginibacter aquariorum]|uniref:DUF4595 domain-containing protein n=1 Tax=Mucilaginibacter aquariorum TaxID=2967225 RepID=A0ABT1T2N6_9SPHI|nr:hypothetical protein [Mucilaginibacter aquariorum]MCQ6958875.1 hypothetical protein [Mucilaginibacter aquariorum]
MNKIFLLLIVLSLIISFQSCKKDGAKPQLEQSKIYLVSKITIDDVFGTHRAIKFTYDNNNRIITYSSELYNQYETGAGDPLRLTYDNDNKLILVEQGAPGKQPVSKIKFVYIHSKPDDKPEDISYDNGITTTVYTVFLNNQNRIMKVNKGLTSLYDNNGHLIFFGGVDGSLNLDLWGNKFDDKNNPFLNVAGLNPYVNYVAEPYPVVTLNNITQTMLVHLLNLATMQITSLQRKWSNILTVARKSPLTNTL